MKIKNLFPKNKKNVSTDEDIKKTRTERFIVCFESMPEVNTTKIGISEIGSTAINVLKRFWRNISCIKK